MQNSNSLRLQITILSPAKTTNSKMKYNKISPNDRKRVIDAFNNEDDWKTVAKTLGINLSTATTWIQNKQETPKKKGGRISKKTPEVVLLLLTELEKNVSLTLIELKRIIFQNLGLDVSINTIKNWLDGELITVKNVRTSIDNMNKQENKIKRADYMAEFFHQRSQGRTFV